MDNITLEILKFMNSGKKYISGQELSEILGLSRTAIWKHIQSLKDKGYQIESVPGKGYHLEKKPDLLLAEEIVIDLNTEIMGNNIEFYESLPSTNKKAKQLAVDGCPEGTVVIAEKQTKGRGRLGREWESPAGKGLWFSLILRPDFSPAKSPFLTIIASLAVHDAISDLDLTPRIKWPNDIILGGKVCGILSELNADMDKIKYGIVGIGINVNQTDFAENLRKKASSLRLEKGEVIDRIKFLQKILKAFDNYYFMLESGQDKKILSNWKTNLDEIGKYVKLVSGQKEYKGRVIDVSDKGELIMETQEGQRISFWAGDTTIISKKDKI